MAASPDPLMLASLPKVTETELRGLQRECIRLMRLEDDKFPGSQPVSFERRHLTPEDEEATRRGVSLLKQEFYAAEKTDGVRYMLLIMGERGAFMVDRNFEMKYATEGSNPRLADPTQVCYSHVRALPWTGGCRRRCASRRMPQRARTLDQQTGSQAGLVLLLTRVRAPRLGQELIDEAVLRPGRLEVQRLDRGGPVAGLEALSKARLARVSSRTRPAWDPVC